MDYSDRACEIAKNVVRADTRLADDIDALGQNPCGMNQMMIRRSCFPFVRETMRARYSRWFALQPVVVNYDEHNETVLADR
jgi:hypothetical protein